MSILEHAKVLFVMVEDSNSVHHSLHPKRRKVLEILARRRARGEGTPTEKELSEEMGYRSAQTIHHHLTKLREEGYVERGGPSRSHRSLALTERGWQAVGEVPLMGRAAAGRGLEAIATDEAYSLAGELLLSGSGKQRYLLRIVGDSMVRAKISDGDLVVVEAEEDPPDGTIVVALLAGDEVTVKRLYRKNSHVLLVAESPDHEDIEVQWGEVQVQGRVMYVIHAAS